MTEELIETVRNNLTATAESLVGSGFKCLVIITPKTESEEDKAILIRSLVVYSFGLDVETLKTKSERFVVEVRRVTALLIRRYTSLRLQDIAGLTGFTIHADVSKAIKIITGLMKFDNQLKSKVAEVDDLIIKNLSL